MGNRSASTTTIQHSSLPPVSHHDIPPQIVIDVGSFSIETDRPVTNDPPPTTGTTAKAKKATYKVPGKHVHMTSIKITRTDDGAILYQNFDADGIEVVFKADVTMVDNQITIKPGKVEGSHQTIEFDSTAVGSLDVIKIPPEEAINGREYKLCNNTFKIKNLTVMKKAGEGAHDVVLFSHDTPAAPAPASQEPSIHPEYTDKRYRVFILVEEKNP